MLKIRGSCDAWNGQSVRVAGRGRGRKQVERPQARSVYTHTQRENRIHSNMKPKTAKTCAEVFPTAKWQFQLFRFSLSPSFILSLLRFDSFRYVLSLFLYLLITCQADIAVWFDFATPTQQPAQPPCATASPLCCWLCACCKTWARKTQLRAIEEAGKVERRQWDKVEGE